MWYHLKGITLDITDTNDSRLKVGVRVLSYARHSGETRKHPGHCIVDKIKDGRYLSKVKSLVYIISDRIEANS